MTEIPGFYSSSQLQDLLGCSYQYVWAIADREGWGYLSLGKRTKLYAASDVKEFLATRTRTNLARTLGFFKGPGLYRDVDHDIECPICFEFAIERPPTPEEIDSEAWQAGEYETEWLCVNGHREGDR